MIELHKHVDNMYAYSVYASYSKSDERKFQTREQRYKLTKQSANKKQRQMFLTFVL